TSTLTKFEVADNTGRLIAVRAKAQLTYDAFGNLSIRGVLEEPLPGQKTVSDAPALAYTGKAIIDTARKEMVLTGTSTTVEPDPSLLAKIGPEMRRRYEFGEGTLTISIMNANGGGPAPAPWPCPARRQPMPRPRRRGRASASPSAAAARAASRTSACFAGSKNIT